MKTINEILTVKNLREAKALGAVRQQDRVVSQATSQRDAAQVSLEEFRLYAKRREDDLFSRLLKHPDRSVRLRDIQEMQAKVSLLRTRERELKTELVTAEDRCDEAAQKLVTCKVRHANASREFEKFIELGHLEASDEASRTERSEEGEAESPAHSRVAHTEVSAPTGGVGG